MTTNIKPSISRWVGLFFASVSAVLLILASLGLFYLSKLDKQIEHARGSAARTELDSAMRAVEEKIQHQSHIFSAWDETRQQLINPDYYGYWKSSRVQRAGVIADFFQNFELFDPQGTPLPGGSNVTLLVKPTKTNGVSLFIASDGLQKVRHITPVYVSNDNPVLLGYAQVEFDLIKLLKQSRSFSYLDPGTLATQYSGPPLELAKLVGHVQFNTFPLQEFSALKKTVLQTYLALGLVILIASIVGYFAIQRRLAKPLESLAEAIDNLHADQDSSFQEPPTISAPMHLQELDTVRKSVQDYREKLNDAKLKLENSNQALQKQAQEDALTGTYNRRAFDDDWNTLIRSMGNDGVQITFMLIDCDHFKPVNDTYGHNVGDHVLRTISNAVNQVLRSNDRLYRIGGDEFVTLLVNADEQIATEIARRCQASVSRQDFRKFGVIEPISISIGIATGKARNDRDLTLLQAHADAAMYQAKRPGNDKIAIYHEGQSSTDDALVASPETNALYQALTNSSKIEMHFQTIQPLQDGQGKSYLEALCRIRYNDTLLSPGRFLPIVHSRRLDSDFDLAVIRNIHSYLHSGEIPDNQGISINLSALSLAKPEVISMLMDLTPHIAAHPLILEITETALVPRLDKITRYLDILRSDGGFKIALDDFGSGFSPMRYLSELPVDIVKFDMSLVHQLMSGGRQGKIVMDFVRLMLDAGYSLVAEGVETREIFEKVQEIGFNYAQGFYLGRPVPIDSLHIQPGGSSMLA